MRAGPRVHRDSASHLMALDLVKWDRETHSMTLVKSYHIVTPLPRTLPLCSVGLPKCSLHPNPGFRAPGWSQIWLIPPNPAGLKPQGGPTLHLLAAALPPPTLLTFLAPLTSHPPTVHITAISHDAHSHLPE